MEVVGAALMRLTSSFITRGYKWSFFLIFGKCVFLLAAFKRQKLWGKNNRGWLHYVRVEMGSLYAAVSFEWRISAFLKRRQIKNGNDLQAAQNCCNKSVLAYRLLVSVCFWRKMQFISGKFWHEISRSLLHFDWVLTISRSLRSFQMLPEAHCCCCWVDVWFKSNSDSHLKRRFYDGLFLVPVWKNQTLKRTLQIQSSWSFVVSTLLF